MSIVIIGAGMAGYAVAKEVRKRNPDVSITVISSDKAHAYNKPLLSNALSMKRMPGDLIQANAQKMAEDYQLTVLNHIDVLEIDRPHMRLVTSQGHLSYESLVIAVGAVAMSPPIAGDGALYAHHVNHLDDYQQFVSDLTDHTKVAIIGPGLIGCEFANDLLTSDKEVCLIGPDPWPISNLLPEEAGRFLQTKLAEAGAEFHLEQTVRRIDKTEAGLSLSLTSGEVIEADVVLNAVGLKPKTRLADQAGLATGKGILVNQFGQTQDSHIFAIGDCAQYQDRWMPYVMPIMHAARAIADTLTGHPTAIRFPIMPVSIKTPAATVTVVPPDDQVQWIFDQTESSLVGRAFIDEKLCGYVIVGEQHERAALQKEINSGLD